MIARKHLDARQELVTLPARDGDSVHEREDTAARRRPGDPGTVLLALVEAKLQGAAVANAPKERGELFIILELQPIHQAITGGTSMHLLQQGITVEIGVYLGTETLLKDGW